MSLHNDPKWVALATLAAKTMGTSDPDIIAAILAQWSCEQGASHPYPPNRNNPGNLARGAAQGLGIPFFVAPGPNPQPGNPIVSYYTPNDGARAYATLIRNGGQVGERYAGVMSAVRAGNGHDYIIEMGQSGYGTGTACMLSAYHPPAPPTDTKPPTGGEPVPLPVSKPNDPVLLASPAPVTHYNLDATVESTGHSALVDQFSPIEMVNGTSHFRLITRSSDHRLILVKATSTKPA
jgi:hypothetical protein